MFRILPSSFVPDEDQGYFFVVAQVSDAASLSVTSRFTQQLEKIILADPAVQDVGTVERLQLHRRPAEQQRRDHVRPAEAVRGAQRPLAARPSQR